MKNEPRPVCIFTGESIEDSMPMVKIIGSDPSKFWFATKESFDNMLDILNAMYVLQDKDTSFKAQEITNAGQTEEVFCLVDFINEPLFTWRHAELITKYVINKDLLNDFIGADERYKMLIKH